TSGVSSWARCWRRRWPANCPPPTNPISSTTAPPTHLSAATARPVLRRHDVQLGMIGLGRMGANILRRVMRDGHTGVAFDTNPESVDSLAGEGAVGTTKLEDFVAALEKPRVAWVMIPAGITGRVVEQLADLMDEGDIIIDGGNSNYREDINRANDLREKG